MRWFLPFFLVFGFSFPSLAATEVLSGSLEADESGEDYEDFFAEGSSLAIMMGVRSFDGGNFANTLKPAAVPGFSFTHRFTENFAVKTSYLYGRHLLDAAQAVGSYRHMRLAVEFIGYLGSYGSWLNRNGAFVSAGVAVNDYSYSSVVLGNRTIETQGLGIPISAGFEIPVFNEDIFIRIIGSYQFEDATSRRYIAYDDSRSFVDMLVSGNEMLVMTSLGFAM